MYIKKNYGIIISMNNRQFIYLLYYDDNPRMGNSKLFLDTVSNINFNLVTHNVYQYEKFIDFNIKIR